MPNFIGKKSMQLLARVFYKFATKYTKIAKINIDIVYKNTLSSEQKESLLKKSIENLFFTLSDMAENQILDEKKVFEKVEFENQELMYKYMNSGKKIIILSGHFANWEIAPQVMSKSFAPLTSVGKKLSVSKLSQEVFNSRVRFGTQMIDEDEKSAIKLYKALKNDRIIALLVDQNTLPDRGIMINLFDKPTRMSFVISKLALKLDAIIVPVFVENIDYHSYKIKFNRALDYNKDMSVEDLTQLQAHAIEEQIKNRPEDWLWLHKRWKGGDGSIYK